MADLRFSRIYKHFTARFRALPSAAQKSALVLSLILLAGAGLALYHYVYRPLSPPQRAAYGQARQLSLLRKDFSKLQLNLQSDNSNADIAAEYLDISEKIGNRCYYVSGYTLPSNTQGFPDDLLSQIPKSKKLCHDLLQVATYSDDIFDAIDAYTSVPVRATWTLPAADKNQAMSKTSMLSDKVSTALVNIEQVLAKDREIRYPGVPEMKIVLQDDRTAISTLDQALREGQLDTANQLWRPTLLTVSRHQRDLLNHRSNYWREFAELTDLQKSVAEHNRIYCSYIPSRHQDRVCQ